MRTVAKKTGRSNSDVGRIRQAAVERGLLSQVTTTSHFKCPVPGGPVSERAKRGAHGTCPRNLYISV